MHTQIKNISKWGAIIILISIILSFTTKNKQTIYNQVITPPITFKTIPSGTFTLKINNNTRGKSRKNKPNRRNNKSKKPNRVKPQQTNQKIEATVVAFKLSETEITNQQYVDFLNSALKETLISVGKIETISLNSKNQKVNKNKKHQFVYDQYGNTMFNLQGTRVIKDHNRDGKFELWEMENPLNRSMIEYNSDENKFYVVDPRKVDWNYYFNKTEFPNIVDKISDWCELHEFWKNDEDYKQKKIIPFSKDNIYNSDGNIKTNITFAGHLDTDCQLPSHNEIKQWPVNHIQYYGAKAFAEYYNFDLPTLEELIWAGLGGNNNWKYATNNGEINSKNTVYNGGYDRSEGKHKGHPQPVRTFDPNPYGIYDLAGNVAEWTKTKDNGKYGARQMGANDKESYIRIDGAWPRPDIMCKIGDCINTQATRGNDHFGFRVVNREQQP